MSDQKATRTVVVTDPIGVHLRTASAIKAVASRSQSQVEVVSEYYRAKGTEIFELLALAAMPGSKVTLEVTGPDARRVLDALEPLFSGDEQALTAALKPEKKSNVENN